MTAIAADRIRGVKLAAPSDSRRRMDFLAQIAKALGIEDATEEKVLEALDGRVSLSDLAEALEVEVKADELTSEKLVEAVKAKADEKPEEKSLEDRAKDEGKVVVDAADYAGVKRDAERGRKAAEELHQSKFDTAFDAALTDPKGPRVDAKDETRERYQKLYDEAPETTLELLENLPRLAQGEARGKTGKTPDVPDNVDAERAELDRKAKAYMTEHKVTYVEALDAVIVAEENES